MRALAAGSLGIAGLSALVLMMVGVGWEPPGGGQYTAFGIEAPRFLIPFACLAFGATAFTLAASSTEEGWRHPRPVRGGLALLAAAMSAHLVVFADEAALGGASTTPARLAGWAALASASALALVPQALVAERRVMVGSLAAAPFVLALGVWATATGKVVALAPIVQLVPLRDVFGQPVLLVIGAVAAAAGILLLWSVALSGHQARDMGQGVAAVGGVLPWLFPALLGVKAMLLVLAYSAIVGWDAARFEASRADGVVSWVIAAALAAAAGWWLLRPRARAAGDSRTDDLLLALGVGYSAPFIAAIGVGLLAAVASLWPTTGPAEALNGWIDFILGDDPPVRLWSLVVVGGLAVIALWPLRSRKAWLWPLGVLALWITPRVVEFTTALGWKTILFTPPSLTTFDSAMTVVLVAVAVVSWRRPQRAVLPGILLLVLVASSLVAHPSSLLPSDWKAGVLFHLLLIYPLVYRFLFDSETLNGAESPQRHGKVMRETGLAAILLASTAMLVTLGITTPDSLSFQEVHLKGVGESFLLLPVAALAVAAAVTRSRNPAGLVGGEGDGIAKAGKRLRTGRALAGLLRRRSDSDRGV